jgi:hypothetical protein
MDVDTHNISWMHPTLKMGAQRQEGVRDISMNKEPLKDITHQFFYHNDITPSVKLE